MRKGSSAVAYGMAATKAANKKSWIFMGRLCGLVILLQCAMMAQE
jgi:hypothetical protein